MLWVVQMVESQQKHSTPHTLSELAERHQMRSKTTEIRVGKSYSEKGLVLMMTNQRQEAEPKGARIGEARGFIKKVFLKQIKTTEDSFPVIRLEHLKKKKR